MTVEDKKLPNYNYVLHILQIRLWEYEGIADRWKREIMKNGPEETICKFEIEAIERAKEIRRAIKKINEYEAYPIQD